MKKISLVIILLASAMVITAASPFSRQPVETNPNDVFGSHALSIFPRPANTYVASFRADPQNLNVFYQFASPDAGGTDYKAYFMSGLADYQWVDVKASNVAGTGPQITANASGWLKDNGLEHIQVTIGKDGVAVHATMRVAYVNNECIFYWSKFYLS